MSDRFALAQTWVDHVLGKASRVMPLAGDASFRRYFRVVCGDSVYVLMDAPPEKEDVTPFLRVRAWLESVSLHVPQLVAEDVGQGFLLLEDFGDMTWAKCLESSYGNDEALFEDALRQLHVLQAADCPLALPVFDMARMRAECCLYLDWYLPHVAKYTPSEDERDAFLDAMSPVLQSLADLPYTPVHLDYHSRNLMLPKQGLPLGVIDFQDAVMGPVTYDLASLLYDCYQDYPETIRHHWSTCFYDALPKSKRSAFDSAKHWHHMLRLTALQRHIKAIGIFARLAYRDGKHQFLDEIPLTRKHVLEEMPRFDLPDVIICSLKRSPA